MQYYKAMSTNHVYNVVWYFHPEKKIVRLNNLWLAIYTLLTIYLTIRLRARVFYKQIVNSAAPRWLSLVENEGE